MITVLGFIVCLVTSLFGYTGWWWLLWGSLIGVILDLGLEDVVVSVVYLWVAVIDLFSCFNGSDD
jgi:hypothetical protein